MIRKLYLLLILAIVTNTCPAEEWSRTGKTEIAGTFQNLYRMRFDCKTPWYEQCDAEKVRLSGVNAQGLTLAHNITDHWHIGLNILQASASTLNETNAAKDETFFDAGMEYLAADAGLTYHLSANRFTPFVTAAIGLADVNIVRDRCEHGRHVTIIEDTLLTIKAGLGLRWDISEHILVRGTYEFGRLYGQSSGDGEFLTVSVAYCF